MSVNKDKKELAVAALSAGTVIDHIPSSAIFQAVRILGLEDMNHSITIGSNLDSRKLGKKGIIKVADVVFSPDVIDRIALIAPTAVVNVIKDYEVIDKHPVKLPETVTGIVRCNNPKCITNNEPMQPKFHVQPGVNGEETILRCHYCNQSVAATKARIL